MAKALKFTAISWVDRYSGARISANLRCGIAHWGIPHNNFRTRELRFDRRVIQKIATGAMQIGGEFWAAEGGREKPEALAKRLFAAIRTIVR
jgi:hypothetical protein